MSSEPDARVVRSQVGRSPRTPWRVSSRCSHGFPTVIASPSVLDDGTPFPTTFWLTCPHLAEKAAQLESSGETGEWARRAADDPSLARALARADEQLRELRCGESGGQDACSAVGIAGQRGPLGVKCLHAHIALALSGVDDPIGARILSECDAECADARCERFANEDVDGCHE